MVSDDFRHQYPRIWLWSNWQLTIVRMRSRKMWKTLSNRITSVQISIFCKERKPKLYTLDFSAWSRMPYSIRLVLYKHIFWIHSSQSDEAESLSFRLKDDAVLHCCEKQFTPFLISFSPLFCIFFTFQKIKEILLFKKIQILIMINPPLNLIISCATFGCRNCN